MRRLALLAAVLLLAGVTAALAASPQTVTAKDFHRQSFERSWRVDNPWFPLRPGTQLVYTGTTVEGKESVPHRIVWTVTDLVKTVGGVRGAVVWDRDYTGGELVEQELSFFAQDTAGNGWHTGEYPEEYEHGKFVKAPAWLADVAGATAGIEMMARPRVGMNYAQGYAPPPVDWNDHAKVRAVGARTCVPVRCFRGVLVIGEYNPGEPGVSQLKSYARGLGNVQVGYVGDDESKEVLRLVAVVHLRGAQLAAARAAALGLERRAYRISKAVYG